MQRDEAKELVKGYLVDYLEQKGINTRRPFLCLNPEHSDKKPSMSYNPRANNVKCFSCGATYDIINLIQIDFGCDFKEAFEKAYEIYNIPIDHKKTGVRPMFRLSYVENKLIGFVTTGKIKTSVNASKEILKDVKLTDILSEKEIQGMAKKLTESSGKRSKACRNYFKTLGIPLVEQISEINSQQKGVYQKISG